MQRFAFLVLALTVAACSDDDPIDPGKEPPVFTLHQLPLLGSGGVTERFTAEIAVRDGIAYTTTWGNRNGVRGDVVKVWNVNGNTPILVDSISVPGAGTTSDVQISDDGRWLVVSTEGGINNGLAIFDRSASAQAPPLAKRHTSVSTVTGVHTVKLSRINNRLYAFMSINPGVFGGNPVFAKLVIADITDPANTTEVFSQNMGNPFVHDVFVRDGILMTAEWADGMRIWDIGGGGRGGSPANPVEISRVQTVNGHVHNIWWYHSPTGEKKYAFIGEENAAELFTMSTGDIHVVDVSNLSNPREVAFFTVPAATTSTGRFAGAHNFSMDEASNILYAAYYNGGVRALDVSGDLSACSSTEKAPDGRCDLGLMKREVGRSLNDLGRPVFIWGVQYVNSRVYASDMIGGIHIIDASVLKK